MFKKAKKQSQTDEVIKEVLDELQGLDPYSEQYTAAVKNLEVLMKAKAQQEGQSKVSPDALLAVGGNLAGILLILNFERLGVVTSKALSFVMKAKP